MRGFLLLLVLINAGTSPALISPKAKNTNSGRFSNITAIVSVGRKLNFSKLLMKKLATLFAYSSTSAKVYVLPFSAKMIPGFKGFFATILS